MLRSWLFGGLLDNKLLGPRLFSQRLTVVDAPVHPRQASTASAPTQGDDLSGDGDCRLLGRPSTEVEADRAAQAGQLPFVQPLRPQSPHPARMGASPPPGTAASHRKPPDRHPTPRPAKQPSDRRAHMA